MKNLTAIFLTLLSALSFHSVKAQTQAQVSLSELEKLYYYSYSDFETYALKKGYHYGKVGSSEHLKIYVTDNPNSSGYFDQLSKGDSSNTVGICTTDSNYYLRFKQELTDNNYTQVGTREKSLPTWFVYSNGKFTATLYSFTTSDNSVWYGVSLIKN